MRVSHRIAKLEDRSTVGVDREGKCRWCHGRREERGGKVVVIRPPQPFMNGQTATTDTPTPTLCPHCGKDMNTYVVINYVNRIAERGFEIGLKSPRSDQ